MTRPNPQPLHPTDKQLLKPLSALGKGGAGGAVSFLRRTEYTSSQGPQHFSSSTSKDLRRANDLKRRKLSVNKEDPLNIIRNIVKGFDVAYPQDAYRGEENTENIRGAQATDPEIRAWSNPKHPTKPDMELLDSYPVLPDIEALPSSGCFVVTKFQNNPVGSGDNYDERLDAAVLRPKDDAIAYANYQRKLADWDQSSSRPAPLIEDDYDYFLPFEGNPTRGIKRKFDVSDPENEDEDLYTDDVGEGQRAFKYTRLRTYETWQQVGDPNNFYNDSVALALHDPETEVGAVPGTQQRLAKGAYFYPIMQRTALKAKRKVGTMAFTQASDEERIDEINLTVTAVDDNERAAILEIQAALDPSVREEAAAG